MLNLENLNDFDLQITTNVKNFISVFNIFIFSLIFLRFLILMTPNVIIHGTSQSKNMHNNQIITNFRVHTYFVCSLHEYIYNVLKMSFFECEFNIPSHRHYL